MSTLYPDHLTRLSQRYAQVLAELSSTPPRMDSLLIHSGSQQYYYADDRGIAFQAYGHFHHWLPVSRPDQIVLIKPGSRPRYFQVVPADFWYEQSIDNANWWADHWDITLLRDSSELAGQLGNTHNMGFIGEETEFAASLGITLDRVNPESLLHYLDYLRAYKTPYEVEQLRLANAQALLGHHAARDCFLAGGSEYEIHMAYLRACNMLEEESPYTNIVALDAKSAILHYQHKRRHSGDITGVPSQVLLVDAGCRVNGYCSDVTRTSVRPGADPVFASLVSAMENLQQNLAGSIKPGMAYPELHREAQAGVAKILLDHELLRGSQDEVMTAKLVPLFFPHGVGHLLGIQVHDVGGRQRNPAGDQQSAPGDSPSLRNTRSMEEDMVFTVEPGLYFIPTLLDPERGSVRGRAINWPLLDRLLPLGGMRIEDNVLVTGAGMRNLTRVAVAS